MAQAETHEFRGSSLDLTNHYYDGNEAEKLRFVQYCEKELGKSTSNGNISSLAFLYLLQKYCYFRNMRGNVCRVADAMTFTSLPSDVQLAFVNEHCSGPREARLECLGYLVYESEIIFVPEEWKFGICSATYPLAVNFDTSIANMEEHTFSTKGLGEGSSSLLKASPKKGGSTTSEIVFDTDSTHKMSKTGDSAGQEVLQKSYSEPSPADELQTTYIKSGGGAQSDLLLDSYSKHGHKTPTTMLASSHNELPAISKPSTSNGTKKKGSRSTKTRNPRGPPSLSTIQNTASPALRVTRYPSISPTKMPTLFPTVYTTEFALSSLSPSPSPSKTMYSIQAVSEQGIVPLPPISRQDPSDESENKYEGIALVLGILFVPVAFLLFVRAYQRQRDPKRGSRELALFEDFSVISENSAILVANGNKFMKSDDSSMSDLESNSSSAFMGNKGLSQRIRQAFNKMYQYMESDGTSVPPAPPPCPPPPKISDTRSEPPRTQKTKTLPKAIVKPYLEIFRPNEISSEEETMGILNIDRGTMLLPSDQIYIQEFAPSRDNSERTIPIMYQLHPSLNQTTSNVEGEPNFQAIHHATPTAKTGHPGNLCRGPFYPVSKDIKHTQGRCEEPVVVAHSTSSLDDSCTAIKSKPIRVDVLRKENSKTDFRIVGLAREDSQASSGASRMSVPFDKEEETPHSNGFPSKFLSQLTPSTFQKLSKELDEMMGGVCSDVHQNIPLTPRRTVSSGNLFSVSSMSRSTSSRWSCDTPIVGASLFWPHQKTNTQETHNQQTYTQQTYTIDVLGEQSPTTQPPRPAIRHSLATGSWIDEFGSSTISRSMSEGPSISSSATSRDNVEGILTETGNVAVTTKQTNANRRLEMINMYPLD